LLSSALKEERESFAIGHFAAGYILAKGSGRLLKVNLNIPIVLTLSIIPDADIIIGQGVYHRGPTHSIILAFLVFLPAFVIYKKTAIPYFIALIQHSLLGDYITGGNIQLFWPLVLRGYGTDWLNITSPANITIEWSLFLGSVLIMFKAKDLHALLRPKKSNLILTIPTLTVLLPTLLDFPLHVPIWLMPPHMFYLVLFLASLSISTRKLSRTLRSWRSHNHKKIVMSVGKVSCQEPITRPVYRTLLRCSG
jgi:membrane-bound metal-dependent hydrolase YbcI (DUF457 family)